MAIIVPESGGGESVEAPVQPAAPPAPAPVSVGAESGGGREPASTPDAYDAAIDAVLPKVDPYDAAMESVRSSQRTAVQSSMYVASAKEPDRQAKVLQLSKETKLPPSIVERNFDTIARKRRVEGTDYDALINDTPALAKFLEDPNNASVASDDLDTLKATELAVKDQSFAADMRDAFTVGVLRMGKSIVQAPALGARASPLEYAPPGFQEGSADRMEIEEAYQGFKVPEIAYNNAATQKLDELAKRFEPKDMNAKVIEEAMAGNYKKAARSLSFALASNFTQLAIIAVSRGAGLATTGLISTAEKNAENLEEGVEPRLALANAAATGAIEAGIESIGGVGKAPVKELVENLIRTQGKGSTLAILKDAIKGILKGGNEEGLEETATSLAQDFLDWGSGVDDKALDGALMRSLNSYVVGFASSAPVTTPMQIRESLKKYEAEHKTAVAQESYLALGAEALKSKLFKRSKDAHAAFVQETVKGTEAEFIYIQPEALEGYFQGKPEDVTQIIRDAGAIDSFNEAKDTGGAVKIPFAQWVKVTADTPHYQGLAGDVKFQPDALTTNEIKADRDQAAAEVKAADDAVKAEQAAVQEKEDASQVAEEFKSALKATGQFDDKQIDAYAKLVQSRYSARAENRGLGESAIDLFRSQGLEFQTPASVEASPEAQAAQMQEQESFEQARRRNQDDPRLQRARELGFDTKNIYFHGTKSDITAFDPSYRGAQNTRAGVKTEQAFYFSMPDDPETASYYAERANFEREQVEAIKANPDIDIEDLLKLGRGEVKDHPEYKRAENAYKKAFKKLKSKADKAGKKVHELPGYVALKNGEMKRLGEVERNIRATDANVVPVFLKFRNPFVFNTSSPENMEFLDKLEKESPGEHHHLAALVEWAKEQGYDAIIREGSERSIAVFDPSQIRSVNAEFDPAKADSAQILDQSGEASPRGRILFDRKNRRNVIQIFEGHDASTVLHEAGHMWLDELITDATTEGVNPNLAKDLDTALEWMGSNVRAKDGAAAVRKAIQTEQHEQWARGFEAYLMEGKAPTQALRKVFAKFKLWLTRIYRDVRGLNVDLTPEVRRVFDRLLVADQVLQDAASDMAYDPLFADPKAMGMNETQAARYLKAMEDAKESAKEELTTELMQDIRREEKAEWKAEEAKVREEVTAQAAQDPAIRALELLSQEGDADTPRVKLDRAAVVEQYGESYAKQLPKAIFGEDGLPPSVVAETLGFGDADNLLETLKVTPTREKFIDGETSRLMQQRFPELLSNPTELANSAYVALHTVDRAKVLRLELEHLASNNMPVLKEAIRRVARRVPTEKAVRAQAEATINKKQIQDISPAAYQAAERRHAREAGKLLAAGDIEGAFEAKRKELLNFELYRAAKAAREDIQKRLDQVKRFKRKDEDLAKTRDTDLINAGRAILQRFGLGRAEKTPDEYLAPMKAYDPEMYANISEIVNGAIQNSAPYKEISYDDFIAMTDLVDAIWELSKSTREMEIDGKAVDRTEITEALGQRFIELTGKKEGLEAAFVTDEEKRSQIFKGLKALITRVEHWAYAMDNGDVLGGSFSKFLVRPVLEATTRYRLARVDTLNELAAIVQRLDIKDPNAVIEAPELGTMFKKPNLLMAILHTGNESNKKKLLVPNGWGFVREDGSLDSSRWDAFLARAYSEGIITKADMDFVQEIWDLNERLKPGAQKAHKKMFGFYFNEITAKEVVTPFGTYRGGYMPAVADPNKSTDANIRSGQSIQEDNPAKMFPTTGRGFTKARQENYTTKLSLDFSKIQNHVDKVLKFTHIEPAVKDATRLVNDRGLRTKMNSYDNNVGNGLLIPWLKRAATQKTTTPHDREALNKGFGWLRRNSSIQFMVANVTNAVQNTTGLFPALTRTSLPSIAGNMKRYLANPASFRASVEEASPYMKTRVGQNAQEVMKEIDDVILDPTRFQKFQDAATQYGYVLERASNGMVEMVVWGAAYDSALSKGRTEKEAVIEADAAVRQALTGMNPEDVSDFETGTPFVKLFTMFSGWFNAQANLLSAEITIARQEGGAAGAARAARAYGLVVAIPAIASALIMRAMAGEGLDEDDDGEYFDDFFDITFGSQLRYLTSFIPAGSSIKALGTRAINGARIAMGEKPMKPSFDDKMSLSPAISNLDKAMQSVVSVPKALTGGGNEGKAIREGLTALGLATGLPAGAVARPLGYAADEASGKVKSTGPVDYLRGLATGKGDKTK